MADGNDYRFDVFPNTTQPFGPVFKENMDIVRLVIDFTCWLEGGEVIYAVSTPAIAIEGSPTPPWQNDYPLDNTSVTVVPVDAYPLTVQSVYFTLNGAQVEIRLAAGTPGINYVVSVVATSSEPVRQRRKQVDVLVTIEQPLNSDLVQVASPDPTAVMPIIVTGNTNLPLDYNGQVYIQNTSGGPITITLPVAPTQLQRVAPVDILGNASLFPVTIAGALPADKIYTSPTYVIDVDYDDLIFEWEGDHWITIPPPVAAPVIPVVTVDVVTPATGGTVVLTDFRAVFVNTAALAALTIRLPPGPAPDPTPGAPLEISFNAPVDTLTVLNSAGGAVVGAPTSAYGPGAAITFRYIGTGWVYWK